MSKELTTERYDEEIILLGLAERPPEDFAINISNLSDNNLSEYESFLGIDIRDLGKVVLDLGSGATEKFSKESSITSSGRVKVVSLNPKLGPKNATTLRDMARSSYNGILWQKRTVAGKGHRLPFKNGVFDSIVSLSCVPYWIEPDYRSETFTEIIRTLKPGGRAFLSPIPISMLESTIVDLNSVRIKHAEPKPIPQAIATRLFPSDPSVKLYRMTLFA